MIKAIFACDDSWGIGKNGALPWPHNPQDLRWFKSMTENDAVIMGRKTWESLPKKPLPNRVNFVISSANIESFDIRPHGVYSGNDITKIVKDVIEARYIGIDNIWIIGGAQLFDGCISVIDELYLSRIAGNYDCDVFLSEIKIIRNFNLEEEKVTDGLCIQKWVKKR